MLKCGNIALRGITRRQQQQRKISSAVRSVMLNLANNFSQCTCSVTEHYERVDGHFKSARNNGCRLYKTATPTC